MVLSKLPVRTRGEGPKAAGPGTHGPILPDVREKVVNGYTMGADVSLRETMALRIIFCRGAPTRQQSPGQKGNLGQRLWDHR